MLRRHLELYFQYLQIIDALLLAGSLWLAHNIRSTVFTDLPLIDFSEVAPFSHYFWMIALILPLGPLILERQGFYRFSFKVNLFENFEACVRSVLILLLVIIVLIVSLHIPQVYVSRIALVLFAPLAIGTLTLREVLFRIWLRKQGESKLRQQHIVLCGSFSDCTVWRNELSLMPFQKFIICAEFDLRETAIKQFTECLHEQTIDIVIFSLDHSSILEVRQALMACEAEGIEAWVAADFFQTALTKPQFDRFLNRPLLVFRSAPDASWQLMVKRMLDFGISFLCLILLSPIFLLIAIGIRLTSGAPIIFKQKRNGLYGRHFTMYKFRTMSSNAEQVRDELQAFNVMQGPVFKLENDPRVTRFGKWLRRNSLDELPQLWNVLKGEMSLVGPRPLPVYETENFDDFSQRRRMSVRPGLTCLWQISGRNQIRKFEDWVLLDLQYIDQWSLTLDFKILLLTIPVVLLGKGAK